MNPGHPLTPAAEFAAKAELEGCHHFRQRTTIPSQHRCNPDGNDAEAELLRFMCLLLPSHAEIGKKAAARTTLLRENFIAAVSVIAHGGGAHQNRRLISQLADGRNEVSGPGNPALINPLLDRFCPTLRDGLSGQMNYRIQARNTVQRRLLIRAPAMERSPGIQIFTAHPA